MQTLSVTDFITCLKDRVDAIDVAISAVDAYGTVNFPFSLYFMEGDAIYRVRVDWDASDVKDGDPCAGYAELADAFNNFVYCLLVCRLDALSDHLQMAVACQEADSRFILQS